MVGAMRRGSDTLGVDQRSARSRGWAALRRTRSADWWMQAPVTLIFVSLVTITSHAALIWHHAVPDFDTDTFIGRANKGCPPHWLRKGMGDTAHPLGNALIPRSECIFHDSGFLTPAQFWYVALTLAVVMIVCLVGAAARLSRAGELRAALAVAYLGASPAMRTMSTRADEKWIGALLFLIVVLAVLAYDRGRRHAGPRLAAVAVGATVLGLWHTQYLVILGVALALWGAVAMVRPAVVGTTRPKASILVVTVLVPPAIAVGILTWSGYVTTVEYHRKFMSIFNHDYWHGLLPWIHDFVTYSARWLPGWLGNDGQQELLFPAPNGVGFVVLGALSLLITLAVAALTRNSLLVAVMVGCLALPFMYEPDNGERWDAVSVLLALCLAVGPFVRDEPRLGGGRSTDRRNLPARDSASTAPQRTS